MKKLLLLLLIAGLSSCALTLNAIEDFHKQGIVDTTADGWVLYKTVYKGKKSQRKNEFYRNGIQYVVKVYTNDLLCNEIYKTGPLTKRFYSCNHNQNSI